MLPKIREGETQPPTHFPDNVGEWANAFYKAKKVEGLSARTLVIYWDQLTHFFTFCDAAIHPPLERISSLTPDSIRGYLLWLGQEGHNAGGVHIAYRVLKTFLHWYELEAEPETWRNPIRKVKAPKLAEEPLEPVPLTSIERMVKTCTPSDSLGLRDRTLLLFLLDTGARAAEVCALDLADVNQVTGAILIRKGKGGKPRTVFLEKIARMAFRAYSKHRKDRNPAAWITNDGKRLGYGGLRAILVRRAALAGVPTPTPHDFRRAFAINMLRNGVDLITLARLMGHSTAEIAAALPPSITRRPASSPPEGQPSRPHERG